MNDYPDWLYDDPDMTYFPPMDDSEKNEYPGICRHSEEEFSLLEEEIFDSGFMPIPEEWFFSSDDPNPLDKGLDCALLARDIHDYQISNRLLEGMS